MWDRLVRDMKSVTSAKRNFLFANREDQRPVQIESLDRRATSRGQSDEPHSVPKEMCRPQISSWVKKRNLDIRIWIDGTLTRAFAQRARNTGQRQIINHAFTARRNWHDVIDMEGCLLSYLRQAAILAATSATLDHRRSQTRRDLSHWVSCSSRQTRWARKRRRESISVSVTSPSASSRSLSERASPRSCRSRRSWSRSLTPGGSRKSSICAGISSSTSTCRDISNPSFDQFCKHSNASMTALRRVPRPTFAVAGEEVCQ